MVGSGVVVVVVVVVVWCGGVWCAHALLRLGKVEHPQPGARNDHARDDAQIRDPAFSVEDESSCSRKEEDPEEPHCDKASLCKAAAEAGSDGREKDSADHPEDRAYPSGEAEVG